MSSDFTPVDDGVWDQVTPLGLRPSLERDLNKIIHDSRDGHY